MMDTRCGASLTLAVPCIIGMLFVYVFGAPNILTIRTLLPELEIEEIINPMESNMFGDITIQIETLAFTGALGDQSCTDIIIDSNSLHLKCSLTIVTNTTALKDIVLCSTNVVCIADNKITGIQNVLMEFPTAFQKMQWSAQPGKKWYNTQTEITSTLVSETKEIFSGTKIDPTELNFGILRSKLSDNTTRKTIHSIEAANKIDFGLQLTWRGSNFQQSEDGSSTPFHYVDFKFAVSENVFNVELRDDKDLMALFVAVLTLFLSIMSLMRMIKAFGARGIDKALKIQSEKNGSDIPEDVLRRQRVLDEHNLTAKGTRRLSSIRNVLERYEDSDEEEEMEVVSIGDGNKVLKKKWKPNPLGSTSMEVEMAELGTGSSSSPPLPPRSIVKKKKETNSNVVSKKETVITKKLRQEIVEIKQMKQQMTQQMMQMKQQMKQEMERLQCEKEDTERRHQEQIHEILQTLKNLQKDSSLVVATSAIHD
jgi:hypothetical protein